MVTCDHVLKVGRSLNSGGSDISFVLSFWLSSSLGGKQITLVPDIGGGNGCPDLLAVV